MSTHVHINVADGAARRHLHIYRVEPVAENFKRQDDIVNYAVEVEGGSSRFYPQRATFFHRYGDPELTLVAEALHALVGHVPQRPAPEAEAGVAT